MCDKLTLRVSLQSHYSTNKHSCDARGGYHVPDISKEGSILLSITPPETQSNSFTSVNMRSKPDPRSLLHKACCVLLTVKMMSKDIKPLGKREK